MPEVIRETFFSDKVRTIATLVLLATILFVIIGTWAFPRNQGVDQQTVDNLREVTNQIQRAADNFEKQSSSTIALNEELTRQLKQAESVRNEGYDQLLKKYGVDMDIVPSDSVTKSSGGMRSQDNHLGSIDIHAGAVTAGDSQQLQATDREHQGKTDGSDSRSSQPAGDNAGKSVGKTHDISGQ